MTLYDSVNDNVQNLSIESESLLPTMVVRSVLAHRYSTCMPDSMVATMQSSLSVYSTATQAEIHLIRRFEDH